MRILFLLVMGMFLFPSVAHAGKCPKLIFDLEAGTMNGLKPTASQDEIVAAIPCVSSITEEGSKFNQGGGVFYTAKKFYVYTAEDYMQIRERYWGKVTPDLEEASRDRVLSHYGMPNETAAKGTRIYYTKPYGCLQFMFGKDGIVSRISIHSVSCKDAIFRKQW